MNLRPLPPIVHEYHYPGGPLTFEYPIGRPIPPEHLDGFSPFVRELIGLSSTSIRERLSARWQGIHADVEPLAEYLRSLHPRSFAMTEGETDQSWVILRRGSSLPPCLLGSPPLLSDEVRSAECIARNESLRHLLAHFGGLQVGMIPPCWGFHVGNRLIHEADQELCWGPTGPWEGALPIYHDGEGNSVCVSTAGLVGIWAHDGRPHRFQDVAGSSGEFVRMFVARQRAVKSPPNEWWW